MSKTKPISLALQGGGAHGAFTWGVLDRLLQEERLEIEGISGTSAGAMNGAVVADGLMRDGRDGARNALERFWKSVSDIGRTAPMQRTPIDVAWGNWNLDYAPSYLLFDLMSRVLSPYQLNPLNVNPLRDLLDAQVDFDRVRACDKTRLFVSATSVRSGKIKVFKGDEISADAVMASACLPYVYQAVEIDGEAYWDGGYMGNPAIYPLIYRCAGRDIVIVQINPIARDELPTTARDIIDRVNEISFNSSLMREMRAIAFVTDLLEQERVPNSRYKRMLVHRIEAEDEMKELGPSSKLNAEWAFFKHLHDIGVNAADAWLERNFDRLGVESTVDIRADYL